jgi:phosphatidylglycerol:prolipoprotein diacylglycerol transferase
MGELGEKKVFTLAAACYAVGYLTGLAAFVLMARRRSYPLGPVLVLAQWALLGGLLSANLLQWLVGGGPGRTVLGGVAGGWLTVEMVKRRLGFRRPTGDLFAVAVCAGEAVGRLGCFFGGCCYGKPTDAAWAVWQHGAMRHPAQLYLSAACLLVLAALLWTEARRPRENELFCLQGILYLAARFGVEFYREGRPAALGLTVAQFACIAGAAFFAVRLSRIRSVPIVPPRIHPPALLEDSA